MSSDTPHPFFDVTTAAAALALGGKLIDCTEQDGRLAFLIQVPAGLDLTDPSVTVPLPTLATWVRVLSQKVKTYRAQQRGGSR